MTKHRLTEAEVRTRLITPALRQSGWAEEQIREEFTLAHGRVIVRGTVVGRGDRRRADYVLEYKPGVPIAVIEAKDDSHAVGDGMQQALAYAEALRAPFVFSSNGGGFLFHDRTRTDSLREANLALDAFPSPATLWDRYRTWKSLTPDGEELVLQDYFVEPGDKSARYYQVNAVNATIEAIAAGRSRLLLVMATGTGKTYTAFQIIWRLWKVRRMKRILFLADRHVLVDQTRVNDFKPFGSAMTQLSRAGGADPSYEIYLALYQSITGIEDEQKLFRKFSPGFFDLIVVDECHRGSAAADSAWREILEYFHSATQIGLTATPKETAYVSNTDYFGSPVYTYTLKQGIADGFLAPYKVVRVNIDLDTLGFHPAPNQVDRVGEPIDDRLHTVDEFDRTIVLDGRTTVVAKKVTELLRNSGDPFQKSIVFCVDQEHAGRVRQALVNENADLVGEDSRYVMRITADDRAGKEQLDNFRDPESVYPVIVTTSRLLSTGVDVPTCRLIVIDRRIESMIEFKQIIGRGTRIHEAGQKLHFTVLDFRGATRHFDDPEFDGEPIQVEVFGQDEVIRRPAVAGETRSEDDDAEDRGSSAKIYVDGVRAEIVAERVRYLDVHGQLVTESLRAFARRTLRRRFESLDDFLRTWSVPERRRRVVAELEHRGLNPADLGEHLKIAPNLDPFDFVCHLAFDRPVMTRRERVANARKAALFDRYGEEATAVLDALLAKYASGATALDDPAILGVPPFSNLGTTIQLITAFGGRDRFVAAAQELEAALYREVA